MEKSSTPNLGIKFSNFINQKTGSFTQDYKLGGVVGIGAFSQVRQVTHRKTKTVRAMQIISKQTLSSNQQQMKFVNEIEALKQLDHPHILKLFEFYQDTHNYYIIIELCTGGELFAKIIQKGNFGEKQATFIMKQLMCAVLYAHNSRIVHRDLQPENILLDITSEGMYNIKIVDWGTSQFFELDGQMTQKYGTPYYIAPEVIQRSYNEKCDIWSCGVILYILLSGRPPFGGRSQKEIMDNVLKGEYSIDDDFWKMISEEGRDLVRKMLQYNPKARISAQEVLEHQWFETPTLQEKIDPEIFQSKMMSLQNFRAQMKLQQAALTFIASQLTSKDERHQLMQTFQALDKNGDGQLSREEILDGYQTMMSEQQAEQEVNRIMDAVDIDKSGSIDYTQFILATMDKKKAISQQRLVESFNLFDKDGDGYITAEELSKVLGGHLGGIDQKVWQESIQQIDANGDGMINLEEFTDMMLKYVN